MKSLKTIERLISMREVCAMTSMSRTTVWHKIKAGEFPKSVKLSDDGVRVAFVESEVAAWIESRISVRDQEVAA